MMNSSAKFSVTPDQFDLMPREAKLRFFKLVKEYRKRESRKRFFHLFPDETHDWNGETFHARSLYAPHMEFIKATADYMEVAFMAGNRTGKSETGTFCDAVWLTGLYPEWWEGRRFEGPTRGWVSGKTNETVRDILQDKLLGEISWRGRRKTVSGTGIIPGECIEYESVTWRSGVQNLVDTIRIKHVSGKTSLLGFKSYAQGRSGFEGTAQHFAHLDEEPPQDIYSEVMTRLATTSGVGISTFTPLDGLTEVALGFMPQDMRPDES